MLLIPIKFEEHWFRLSLKQRRVQEGSPIRIPWLPEICSDRFIFSNCACTPDLGLLSRQQWKLISLKVSTQQPRLQQMLWMGPVIHLTLSQNPSFLYISPQYSPGQSLALLNLWFSFNSLTCSFLRLYFQLLKYKKLPGALLSRKATRDFTLGN